MKNPSHEIISLLIDSQVAREIREKLVRHGIKTIKKASSKLGRALKIRSKIKGFNRRIKKVLEQESKEEIDGLSGEEIYHITKKVLDCYEKLKTAGEESAKKNGTTKPFPSPKKLAKIIIMQITAGEAKKIMNREATLNIVPRITALGFWEIRVEIHEGEIQKSDQ